MPDASHIADALRRAGITPIAIDEDPGLGPVVRVPKADAKATLLALRDSTHAFTFPVDIFGIDTGEAIEIVYHLRSFSFSENVVVKVEHDHGSDLESIWEVFPAALMPEREAAEMFGLTLSNHPNPKHLLLTSGIEPLLLKRVPIRTAEEVRNR